MKDQPKKILVCNPLLTKLYRACASSITSCGMLITFAIYKHKNILGFPPSYISHIAVICDSSPHLQLLGKLVDLVSCTPPTCKPFHPPSLRTPPVGYPGKTHGNSCEVLTRACLTCRGPASFWGKHQRPFGTGALTR